MKRADRATFPRWVKIGVLVAVVALFAVFAVGFIKGPSRHDWEDSRFEQYGRKLVARLDRVASAAEDAAGDCEKIARQFETLTAGIDPGEFAEIHAAQGRLSKSEDRSLDQWFLKNIDPAMKASLKRISVATAACENQARIGSALNGIMQGMQGTELPNDNAVSVLSTVECDELVSHMVGMSLTEAETRRGAPFTEEEREVVIASPGVVALQNTIASDCPQMSRAVFTCLMSANTQAELDCSHAR